MDLLKREMERKKAALKAAKAKSSGGGYLKAGELRKVQEEEEDRLLSRKRQRLMRNDAKERIQETSSTTEAEAPSPAAVTAKKPRSDSIVSSLSHDQILGRLRNMALPVKLFGESFGERKNRLRKAMTQAKAQSTTQSEMDEFRLGKGHGIRNPFIGKDAKTNHLEEEEGEKKKDTGSSKGDKEQPLKVDEDFSNDPHKLVYKYFKGLLKQWEEDLVARPEAIKRTAAGKNEAKTLKQCKDYIQPLFKLCKKRLLEESLLGHISKIVNYCQEGEFVKAHDTYLDVAIGRAAWPIGVTSVGIHARTGREKIESAKVAHVMNSELQRKYLTSVKRLMTYAQKKASNVAPSKKVMS